MNRSLLKSILSFTLTSTPAFVALMAPDTAWANDGSLKGVVKNAQTGDPIEGALVVLQCGCLAEEKTTMTSGAGVYAFEGLPQGNYTVQVLAGKNQTTKVLQIQRGQAARANFSSSPKKAERRVIDVESSPVVRDTSATTEVKMSQVAKVPVGSTGSRDFTAVVDMAPTADRDAAGISLAGSTGAETRYSLDGASVNNPSMGTVGAQVVQEFVESIEIKEAGYDAELGGASGGQVLAKRIQGSNELRGKIRMTVTPRLAKPRLIETTDEAVRSIQTQDLDSQIAMVLSGPIIKDRLFFSAYLAPKATSYSLIQSFYHRIDLDNSGGFEDCEYENGQNDCAPGTAYIATERFDDQTFRTGEVQAGWGLGIDWIINTKHKLGLTVRGGPTWQRVSYRLPIAVGGGPSSFGTGGASAGAGATTIATGIVNRHLGWTRYSDTNATLNYEGRILDGNMEIDGLFSYYRGGSQDAWKLDNEELRNQVMTQESDNQGRNLFQFLDRDNAVSSVADVGEKCNDDSIPGDPCPTRTWLSGGLGQSGSDFSERVQAVLKLTHYFDAAGTHKLRYGGEFEWLRRHTVSRYSGYNAPDFYDNCEAGETGGGEWCFDGSNNEYRILSDVSPNRVNNNRYILVDSDNPDQRTTRGYGRARKEQEDLRAITTPLAAGVRVSKYDEWLGTYNYAAFLQDQWSILPNLYVNAGVRWEAQDMRDIFNDRKILIADNIAPRVGAYYDWTDEGRSRLYVNYGWFYNQLPLALNSRVFGGNIRVDRSMRFSDCEGRTTNGNPHVEDGQPTEWCVDVSSLGGTSGTNLGAVVPRLKGQYSKQFQIGYQQEVIEDLTLGVRWLHTDLGRAVEDVSTNGGNDFIIANPGERVAKRDIESKIAECEQLEAEYDRLEAANKGADENKPIASEARQCRYLSEAYSRINTMFVPPSRNYDAWTLEVRKSFGNNWLLSASYTHSRLIGNYDGYVDPNTGAVNLGASTQYDLPELVRNSFGPLSGNSPHRIKIDALYNFDLNAAGRLILGTSARFRSGAPISIRADHARYAQQFLTYLLPRGAGGRIEPNYQINLSVGYSYPLPKDVSLDFTARLINVTNAKSVMSVDTVYSFSTARPIAGGDVGDLKHARAQAGASQTEFFNRTLVTPQGNFGVPRQFQAPLSAQFDLSLSF